MIQSTFGYLSILLLVANSVKGSSPFIGCVESPPTGTVERVLSDGGLGCADTCAQEDYTYSFEYGFADPPLCACGNAPAAISSYIESDDRNCNGYAVVKTTSPFIYEYCTSDTVLRGQKATTTVGRFSECFVQCLNYQIAVVESNPDNEDLACFCGDAVASNQGGSCSRDSLYVYSNDFTSPSGALKKRLKERVERNTRRGFTAFCPPGMTACNVPDVADAFECMNIQTELESCGGCLSGQFNEESKSTSNGVDCSAMPGVALGATTCVSGKCEVYACKKGWVWIDGTCSKISK